MFACEIPHNMQRAATRIASTICALLIVCIAPGSRSTAQIKKTTSDVKVGDGPKPAAKIAKPDNAYANHKKSSVCAALSVSDGFCGIIGRLANGVLFLSKSLLEIPFK